MVRGEVAAVASVTLTPGALHVGGLAPAPVTAQLRATAPVKPPVGLTVRVSVAVFPGATVTLVGEGVTEKPGATVLAGASTCNPRVWTYRPVLSAPVSITL